MSDPYTEVQIEGGEGFGIWGFEGHAEAVAQARSHYTRQWAEAELALMQIDAGHVRVFHQRGPYAASGRVEVPAMSNE